MSATVLTAEAAKAANIEIITNGKYTQAVHETVVAYRANRRSGTASVKTKGTVNGSGAKPWKQKGTGRARAGYKSSPVWVGGGVVFGPHPRDYSKKISKQVKRIALRKALSARILAGDVLMVPSFEVAAPKTKDFVTLIGGISTEPKTLVVGKSFDTNTKLAARNVACVQLISSADVNTENLLAYRKIVMTNDALTELAETHQQMNEPFDIISKVHLTEKATILTEKFNQYVFKVKRSANKVQIRQAIEKLFKKKVVRVNTANFIGKLKRGRTQHPGFSSDWKKAIVTLAPGEKIEFA